MGEKGIVGDKVHGNGIRYCLKNVGRWRSIFFGWVWRGVMRRQMRLQSNLYTQALYLPISSLLLNSLKMASQFPLLNPLSTLLWHFLNPYPLWPDLLTVFDMVDQPCPLDSFSLFEFHDNGASWFSWWVFVTSFASFPPKVGMAPTFNFILFLIHPFISLIQYIFIEPLACAKHMAAIKLRQN